MAKRLLGGVDGWFKAAWKDGILVSYVTSGGYTGRGI